MAMSKTKAVLLAAVVAIGAATAIPAAAHQEIQGARRCTPGYRPCIPNRRSDVDCYGGGEMALGTRGLALSIVCAEPTATAWTRITTTAAASKYASEQR